MERLWFGALSTSNKYIDVFNLNAFESVNLYGLSSEIGLSLRIFILLGINDAYYECNFDIMCNYCIKIKHIINGYYNKIIVYFIALHLSACRSV